MAFNQTHDIEAANAAHLACVLLLDTSGSMCGEKIEALNQGLKDFKEIVGKDEEAKSCVDVAIVEFNNEVRVVQDFKPLHLM